MLVFKSLLLIKFRHCIFIIALFHWLNSDKAFYVIGLNRWLNSVKLYLVIVFHWDNSCLELSYNPFPFNKNRRTNFGERFFIDDTILAKTLVLSLYWMFHFIVYPAGSNYFHPSDPTHYLSTTTMLKKKIHCYLAKVGWQYSSYHM